MDTATDHQLLPLLDLDLDFSDIFHLLNSPHSNPSTDDAHSDTSGGSSQQRDRCNSFASASSDSGNGSSTTDVGSPFKNTDTRRAASRIGARRRRGSESRLLQDLAQVIAPHGGDGKMLDKMSTLRLAVSNLKLRRILAALGAGAWPNRATASTPGIGVEDALGGGFLLVLSTKGDLVYVSPSVAHSLGFSSFEVMGRSIYEFTNPADQPDVLRLLAADYGTGPSRHSGLVRLRCSTRTARDPNHMRTDPYKVFHVSGKLYGDPAGDFFVGVADPIPHPADNRFPVWSWLNQQMFTTVHTLDMKFISADASMTHFLGYDPQDYIGLTCFEFIHPEDAVEDMIHIKELYEKGQTQTDRFRILTKGGGHAWVYTQKTSLNSNAVISSRNRTIVVCRHFVLGLEPSEEIYSTVQLAGVKAPASGKFPALPPAPQREWVHRPPPRVPSIEEITPMEEQQQPVPEFSQLDEYMLQDDDVDALRNLAADVDFEALPAFAKALDAFFAADPDPVTDSATSDLSSSWSTTSDSLSPPVQILGKRARSGLSSDGLSEAMEVTDGCEHKSSKPIAIVPALARPPPEPAAPPREKQRTAFPTLMHLLTTQNGDTLRTLITTKKYKSYQME